MDEPCSALDPISTLAIEDLIGELKEDYTIVIVTHNMQQAARVSDQTAFFNLEATGKPGQARRDRRHREDLLQPDREGDRGLHLRPLRLTHRHPEPDFVRFTHGSYRPEAAKTVCKPHEVAVSTGEGRMPLSSTASRRAFPVDAGRHRGRMRLDLSTLPTVFLTSEAADEGLDSRRLATARKAGPSTGAVAESSPTRARWPSDPVEQHVLLAQAAARAVDDCALSHVSAAVSLGCRTLVGRLPRPAVTVDDHVRSRSPGSWMTLYRGELPRGHVEAADGVRRTTAPRTVADCARHLPLGDALAIADAAVRAGLTTATAVRDLREFERRWPGSLSTDRVLSLLDPRREGWLESWSAAAFHRMELPTVVPPGERARRPRPLSGPRRRLLARVRRGRRGRRPGQVPR